LILRQRVRHTPGSCAGPSPQRGLYTPTTSRMSLGGKAGNKSAGGAGSAKIRFYPTVVRGRRVPLHGARPNS
jgi:hypothetical protein